MAKYLLLKHYRGAPASVNDIPMDRWTPEEISAHIQYMNDFAARLEKTGEFVDSQALSPRGPSSATTARAARRSPTARSPRPRTSSLTGWSSTSTPTSARSNSPVSCRPRPGPVVPIHEWLELRPFMGVHSTTTECTFK